VTSYTDQLQNPENKKGVSSVRITLPLEYLKKGVRFYDTPGLNDVILSYGELSTRFLDEMNAVIITSLYPPFTRGEIDFLKRASHKCDKLFVVVNLSSDYWSERHRLKDRVVANITRDHDLREHPDLHPDRLRLYVLNARQAWEGVLQNKASLLEKSQFLEFRRDLEQFLAQDASRLVLASSIRNSFEVITLLQKLLTLRSEILFSERSEIEKKIESLRKAQREAELKKYELFDAIDGEMASLVENIEPQVQGIVEHTVEQLKQIQQGQAFGKMLHSLEDLYRQNVEKGNEMERFISERVEAIFRAARRWMDEQLDRLFHLGLGDSPAQEEARRFTFSRAQKSLLGVFEGFDDHLGIAEAVVGLTTVSATMAAGGKGLAILTPLLGPLAFPVGGAGGFFVGLFARNWMKVRHVRQHIDLQLRHLEGERDLLADKIRVVLERISGGVKSWVSHYFEGVFLRVSSILEEHQSHLNERGYLERRRLLLEERQVELDQLRDRFLSRLEEIRSLLQPDRGDPDAKPSHL
jgi:hypothetical protein